MPCIFCDIAAGKSPASVIYQDEDVMALLDVNPVQRGHSLVIPKRHYVDIWDIDPEVLREVVLVTGRVAERMKEVWGTEGVNTFSASGKPAGQDIYHFHMRVIPLGKGENEVRRVVALSGREGREARPGRACCRAQIQMNTSGCVTNTALGRSCLNRPDWK